MVWENRNSVLEIIKKLWAENQAESAFDDWTYVALILRDHFFSQVENKTEKEFIVYLRADLGYDDELIDSYFKDGYEELSNATDK